MAIARGAHTSIEWIAANDSAAQTTGAIDTTGMNLIVLGVTTSSGLNAPTDSKGNTYTLLVGPVTNGDNIRLYYCLAPTIGAGHTFTITPTGGGAGNNYGVLTVMGWSGIATSSAVDQQNSRTQNATTSWDTNNVTTTQADELLVSVGELATGTNLTFGAGTGWTMQETRGNAANTSTGYLQDRIVSATGTYTGDASAGGVSGNSAAIIATFKGAAGGGASTGVALVADAVAFPGLSLVR
jgi:hypothetical protein